jgi:hypothetical protein
MTKAIVNQIENLVLVLSIGICSFFGAFIGFGVCILCGHKFLKEDGDGEGEGTGKYEYKGADIFFNSKN